MPPHVAEEIERRIRVYPRESSGHEGHDKAVRLYNALPIGHDLGVTIFVTPEGRLFLLEVDDELEGEPMPIIDVTQRNAIFHVAGAEIPELLELLPARPADARECSRCRGGGFVSPPDEMVEVSDAAEWPCPACGSLGWVAREEGEEGSLPRALRATGRLLGRLVRRPRG